MVNSYSDSDTIKLETKGVIFYTISTLYTDTWSSMRRCCENCTIWLLYCTSFPKFKVQSLFQYLMSYRMTKRELQHMIYMTKTKFHIKRGKLGEREKRKEKGSVIMDIHKQYVWGEIQNTYQRKASPEVIIRLTNFKRYVNFCGGVHGFICIISWNNNVFGIRLLCGLIILFLSQLK